MTHGEEVAAVRQSLVGRPRDTYPARQQPPITSHETEIAAENLNAALAWLEVTRRVGVAREQAVAEFEEAKAEIRRCVAEDIRRTREARS